MSNIQKTLDSLQPYVIGIRYVEGVALVDAVFKEGWAVPDEPNIKKVKGNEEMNYFMIYSENENIGIDELLGFVDRTIKLNIEREKKHELLKEKVNELKELFKRTPLTKLNRLKFTFAEEELVPTLNDFDIEDEIMDMSVETMQQEPIIETVEQIVEDETPQQIEDAGNLTEEEREILEEEARAEKNRKYLANKKNKANSPANKVELPPKKKFEAVSANDDYFSECECGPNEACDKCIDAKSL